jgi:2-dehydro-3-deoxyphosphooctonate aldolase (KDO 8-P synthase)
MQNKSITVGKITVGGGGPLFLIAGPCVIESTDLCLRVAESVKKSCAKLGLPYIFKASFDKANRTSGSSFRGVGMDEGLETLARVKKEFDVPVLTDVHETNQVSAVAEVADVLQIPAFLCRQTDLIISAAKSGKAVNIKKGQFMSPEGMKPVLEKAVSAGNKNVMLTERGVSFGYNTLVSDMRALPIMRSFGHPVVYDATHSVQRPAGLGDRSGGDRAMVAPLARAAAAVGVDGFFIETHPKPESAKSDAESMLPLAELPALLEVLVRIDEITRPRK